MIELTLTDKMPFGKFKDQVIGHMLSENNYSEFSIFGNGNPRSYLKWFEKNIKTYSLSKEVLATLYLREKEISNLQSEAQRLKIEYDSKYPDIIKKKYKKYNNMNEDYREAGMSLSDMGYTGDGGF